MGVRFDGGVAIVNGAGVQPGHCSAPGFIAAATVTPKTNNWAMHLARPRNTLSMQQRPMA